MNEFAVMTVIWLILRVVGPIYCAFKADNLNRKPGGWAIAGFLFPVISMIWISTLSPVTVWTKE
jgi:hypothetical protein